MSRDASGQFNLAPGNPVITGTIIETQWANPTLADIAAGLTDSLSRSGKGGMNAPLAMGGPHHRSGCGNAGDRCAQATQVATVRSPGSTPAPRTPPAMPTPGWD
jgi:hypothetical protein